MKKETLRYKLVWYREALLFVAVGTSLLITLNQPKPKVTSPKTYKPVIVTEQVIEKEPVHYLTDEDFSRLYTLRDDVKNDTCLELTVEEAELVMRIARAEGGDTLEGQLWVMRLIINRLLDGNFGDSIFAIVSAEKQFEVYRTGAYKKAELNANSHLALALLESGWNETEGALYFEASCNSADSWHKHNRVFIKNVEGNLFYR